MKKNNNSIGIIVGVSIVLIFLISSLTTVAFETVNRFDNQKIISPLGNNDTPPYEGHIRVYVVEPVSRWENYDRDDYHFGFLDFAINKELSIEYMDTYEETVIWDASEAGYDDVEEDNIIVMAAVFNPESEQKYAYPRENKNLFDAHYVDAATAAYPGETGYNTVTENFTHTVFIEEATAPWCPFCPDMAEKLYFIYRYWDYPFYFVALISSVENLVAEDRLFNDLNVYALPTSYFDGGYQVMVGGGIDREVYLEAIESSGKRDVHELDLTLSVEWIGNGNLEIYVSVTSNEEVPNEPPEKHTIIGPTSGKAGEMYNYTFMSNDPEEHDVYYLIDWGDNTSTEWLGVYKSGEEINLSHIWTDQGNYIIKAKAKDIYDLESDWATLEISMPKNKIINYKYVLQRILDNHPLMSPVLRQILKL